METKEPQTIIKKRLVVDPNKYTVDQCARVYLLALLWPDKYELVVWEGFREAWDKKINLFLAGVDDLELMVTTSIPTDPETGETK